MSGKGVWHLAAYTLLAAIALFNLNGVISILWETTRALSLAMGFLLLILLLAHRRSWTLINQSSVLVLTLFVTHVSIGGIGGFANSNLDETEVIGKMVSLSIGYVMTLVVARYFSYLPRRQLSIALWVTIAILTSSSVAVVVSYFSPAWQALVPKMAESGRASGFFGNPNEAAVQGCMMLALTVGVCGYHQAPKLAAILLPVGLGAGFLTFSRSAMAIAPAVMVVSFIGIFQRFRARLVLYTLIAVPLALLCLGALLSLYSEQSHKDTIRRLDLFSELVTSGRVDEETTGGRSVLLERTIAYWWKSPLFGNGLASTDPLPFVGKPPHNTLAAVLAEAGILPFGLFMLLIFAMATLSVKCTNPIKILVWGYLIVYVGSCMLSNNILDDRNQNLLLGLTMGLLSNPSTRRGRRNLGSKSIHADGGLGREKDLIPCVE
jgi:O-antigen ligase